MAKGQEKELALSTYGIADRAAAPTSPDRSGSPQQPDAITFTTGLALKYKCGQVVSLPFARTTSKEPVAALINIVGLQLLILIFFIFGLLFVRSIKYVFFYNHYFIPQTSTLLIPKFIKSHFQFSKQ
jgi:hypothetical protein